jgi:hypothetical protein
MALPPALHRLERIAENTIDMPDKPDTGATEHERWRYLMQLAIASSEAVLEHRQALPEIITVLRELTLAVEELKRA